MELAFRTRDIRNLMVSRYDVIVGIGPFMAARDEIGVKVRHRVHPGGMPLEFGALVEELSCRQ